MLADDDAAAAHQRVGRLSFTGDVKPRVGVGHVHVGGGDDGRDAQEERGVAGNHFRVRISAHVAHIGIGDGARVHHFLQLHAGHDSGDVTGLVDVVEEVAEVGKALGFGMGASGVGKVDVRIFLSGLNHVSFVTEGVGKDDVAALLRKVHRGIIAGFALTDGILEDQVRVGVDAQRLASGLDALHVGEGVAFVLVADQDCTHLEIRGGGGSGAGGGTGTGGRGGGPSTSCQTDGH